jgi:hypothetical protein
MQYNFFSFRDNCIEVIILKSKKSLERKLEANKDEKNYKDIEKRSEKETKGISGKYSSSGNENNV